MIIAKAKVKKCVFVIPEGKDLEGLMLGKEGVKATQGEGAMEPSQRHVSP